MRAPKIKTPKIKIGDKEYRAGKLKMKAWRSIVKLQKEIGGLDQASVMNDEAAMEKMAEVLEIMMNNPQVTADLILEEMDLVDFVPAVQEVAQWVAAQVSNKLDQFPKNSPTTVAQS